MGDALCDGGRNEHVECLAWGREVKKEKKQKKNLSPQVFARVFSHCHQDSPPQGGCLGASGRKPAGSVANASRAAVQKLSLKKKISK